MRHLQPCGDVSERHHQRTRDVQEKRGIMSGCGGLKRLTRGVAAKEALPRIPQLLCSGQRVVAEDVAIGSKDLDERIGASF